MSDWMRSELSGWDAKAVEVLAAEFVVTTHAAADIQEYTPLAALLLRVHEAFGVELAFVSEWASGRPLARRCHGDGVAEALQAIYGRRLLEKQLPRPAGAAFEAIPVVCSRGFSRGTLCCRYDRGPQTGAHGIAEQLRSVARLIACWFDSAPSAA